MNKKSDKNGEKHSNKNKAISVTKCIIKPSIRDKDSINREKD